MQFFKCTQTHTFVNGHNSSAAALRLYTKVYTNSNIFNMLLFSLKLSSAVLTYLFMLMAFTQANHRLFIPSNIMGANLQSPFFHQQAYLHCSVIITAASANRVSKWLDARQSVVCLRWILCVHYVQVVKHQTSISVSLMSQMWIYQSLKSSFFCSLLTFCI